MGVQCFHQSALINLVVQAEELQKISIANKTIIDVFDDDNNDDISRFERHGNIAGKCELSSTSNGHINLVGTHVRSKKHERFIFKEVTVYKLTSAKEAW